MDARNVARICHEANRAYCAALGDRSKPAWEDAPMWQRESALDGVEYLRADPTRGPYEAHKRWLDRKRDEGWRYAPEPNYHEKLHPCILPFDLLPPEEQAKDHLFHAIVRALS